MGIANFSPTLWTGSLLVAERKALQYGQPGVVNRNYEGEIRQKGDSVKILSIGRPTIRSYSRNTAITAPEQVNTGEQMLNITEEKYFNIMVDDVDKAQASVSVMEQYTSEGAYGLADTADQFIAAKYTEVPSANLIGSDGSPKVPTANTATTAMYEYLVDLGVLLSDAKVPKQGRFAVLPPWCVGLLDKDDRFVKAGTSATDARLRDGLLMNGFVGHAAGFQILESHNVPNTSGALYKIIAGHPSALSFAEQLLNVEAYRPDTYFADAIKALHVYGAKLVRPDHWAVLTASKS